MSDHCEKHKTEKSYGECDRCGGDGYTQWDLDEYNDPLSFHDGNCHMCRGFGIAPYKTCEECEREAYEEMEDL